MPYCFLVCLWISRRKGSAFDLFSTGIKFTDGLNVPNNSVEKITSHGRFADLAFHCIVRTGRPLKMQDMQTISTSRLTFPFDNVAITACFFNKVNPSTTSGQPKDRRR